MAAHRSKSPPVGRAFDRPQSADERDGDRTRSASVRTTTFTCFILFFFSFFFAIQHHHRRRSVRRRWLFEYFAADSVSFRFLFLFDVVKIWPIRLRKCEIFFVSLFRTLDFFVGIPRIFFRKLHSWLIANDVIKEDFLKIWSDSWILKMLNFPINHRVGCCTEFAKKTSPKLFRVIEIDSSSGQGLFQGSRDGLRASVSVSSQQPRVLAVIGRKTRKNRILFMKSSSTKYHVQC